MKPWEQDGEALRRVRFPHKPRLRKVHLRKVHVRKQRHCKLHHRKLQFLIAKHEFQSVGLLVQHGLPFQTAGHGCLSDGLKQLWHTSRRWLRRSRLIPAAEGPR